MKLLVCSVYDRATAAFMPPFFARSKGEAIRSFMDACSDGKTQFCRYPADYTLFLIGDFDDQTGMLSGETTGERLITAQECIAKVPEIVTIEGAAETREMINGRSA